MLWGYTVWHYLLQILYFSCITSHVSEIDQWESLIDLLMVCLHLMFQRYYHRIHAHDGTERAQQHIVCVHIVESIKFFWHCERMLCIFFYLIKIVNVLLNQKLNKILIVTVIRRCIINFTQIRICVLQWMPYIRIKANKKHGSYVSSLYPSQWSSSRIQAGYLHGEMMILFKKW